MYLLHNGEKHMCYHSDYDFVLDIDENNEVFLVLQDIPIKNKAIYLNNHYLNILTAYYCSLANKSIKIIDDEILVPVLHFIIYKSEFMGKYGKNASILLYDSNFVFWEISKKLKSYILFDGECVVDIFDQDLEGVIIKQYDFDKVTLLIIEINNDQSENPQRIIATCKYYEPQKTLYQQFVIEK